MFGFGVREYKWLFYRGGHFTQLDMYQLWTIKEGGEGVEIKISRQIRLINKFILEMNLKRREGDDSIQ